MFEQTVVTTCTETVCHVCVASVLGPSSDEPPTNNGLPCLSHTQVHYYYYYIHTYTYTRLTALFRDYPGEPVPER